MAGIYVNDEGTWKLPKSIWVNQLGTWRVCSNVYVNKSGAWREMIKSVDLDSSKENFNLYEYVGSPAQPLSLIFNIGSNKEITSPPNPVPKDQYGRDARPMSATTVPTAFTVGNFPSGSTVIINNNGYISGGGGYGGGGKAANKVPPGQNAGNGIEKGSSNNFDCTIVNTGTIAAGGGGGGGGLFSGWYGQGAVGGEGAGIPGYNRTQGGPSQFLPAQSAGFGPSYPSSTSGQGGDNGGDGEDKVSAGGKGGKAIISNGIEIAVSGTILGEVV